jgi:hypothetical protein
MRVRMKRLPLSAAAILLCPASVLTQQRPVVTTITGHAAKAERRPLGIIKSPPSTRCP